jgi:phosphopantetheine--protein transferase-like protein
VNTSDTLPVILNKHRISIHEPGRISFSELNSPALIILKTGDVNPEELNRLGSFLSEEETLKSLRFRFARDRMSYTVVHGMLRWMLGRKLGISPKAVKINYNSYGKPSVAGYPGELFFNLSHSSGVSVLAFDPGHTVGVDVERIDEDFDYKPIVQHFFSHGEGQYIFGLKEASRQRFYEIWTRKEAYLKAMGLGITEHLHVEVLKEKINGCVSAENEQVRNDIVFRTMMFETNFRITLAMDPDTGDIPAFAVGNNENNLPIFEA